MKSRANVPDPSEKALKAAGKSATSFPWCLDEADYVRGRQYSGNVPVKIAKRHVVMLDVARTNALGRYDHIIVTLIRVDGGHAHARVRVHSGDHQDVGSDIREAGVEIRGEEGAVALLDDHRVGGQMFELRQELTARG